MQHNSRLPILLALIFLPIIFTDTRKNALTGGWKPIHNIEDPHVTEIAQFAVGEHNKESKTSLILDNVVKGETQVIAGTKYRLVLQAKDGTQAAKTYEAVVWEKASSNSKNLTSFNPVEAGVPASPPY